MAAPFVTERIQSGLGGRKLAWPIDDYVFHMVLRQGRMINRPNQPCTVEVIDFSSDSKGQQLVFHMSPLDASTVAAKHAEFVETGLPGKYKLSASTGLLKLISAYGARGTQDLSDFLLDPCSNELVRSRYAFNLSNK